MSVSLHTLLLLLREKNYKTIKYLTPADYKCCIHIIPTNSVALVYQSSFKVGGNRRDIKSFELLAVDVSSSGNFMKHIIIYRHLSSKNNTHSYADILIEFTGFIEHIALITSRFAIVSDCNIMRLGLGMAVW